MPPQIEVLGPWFRGHSNSEWSLVPKLYRQEDHDRNTEDEIREEFITRAPSLTEAHPSNEWQWYFLMQHYGAPTRLLDWTDGGLIGLYFAVRDNRGCSDAAVWMLDPWWLNGKVVGKQEVVCPDALGVLRGIASVSRNGCQPDFIRGRGFHLGRWQSTQAILCAELAPRDLASPYTEQTLMRCTKFREKRKAD
jgi:hypothetical protein